MPLLGSPHAKRSGGFQPRRAELAAIRHECEFLADVLCEFLREPRKAGFNPDEPRVPAGNPDGGQWTTGDNGAASTTSESSGPVLSDAASDSNWIPGAQYAANDRSSNGGNQGAPLGQPPAVPAEQPASNQAINAFLKAAAYFLAGALLAAEPVGDFILALEAADWLSSYLPYVHSYLDPPKTLEELREAALNPRTGYNVHHIVEQTPAAQDGFSWTMIDGPDNLVLIPTLKHWQINGWYSTPNQNLGGLSPRNYLRGKSWEERIRNRQAGINFIWGRRTMKQADLTGLTVGELVERFAAMGVAQNKALLWDEYAEFSRLYWQMDEIRNELQERPGDQRRALMTLFNHADPQVRLKAGLATIDVTPDAAREVLQKLVDTRCYPQAADALATIWHLDGRPIVQR